MQPDIQPVVQPVASCKRTIKVGSRPLNWTLVLKACIPMRAAADPGSGGRGMIPPLFLPFVPSLSLTQSGLPAVKRAPCRVAAPLYSARGSGAEMDVGPFFFTQPTMLTQGPNPTHPSHTYVKCRRQHCKTHILHARWWNKHPVSSCDWLSSCSENSHPLYTKFEPNTSPAFFCKTTIACTLSVDCVRITRVICKFS